MSKFATVLKTAGVIAGVILVGVLVGWWGSRSRGPGPAAPVPAPKPVEAVEHTNVPKPPVTAVATRVLDAPKETTQPPVPNLSANIITNWEDRLDQVLGSEGEDSAKAKELLDIFPRLPPAGQEEVAQHISNLTADKDYAPLGQYLTNYTLPGPVLDVLMQDLLNRPNSVKLPLLLDVAREPQHPGSSEAKDLLELYLEDNYGNDWNKWQEKLQQWLKDNPD
jgi:hypothetical protein